VSDPNFKGMAVFTPVINGEQERLMFFIYSIFFIY